MMAHEIAHAIAQHGAERMLQEQLTQVALTSVSASLSSQDPAVRGALLGLFGAGAEYGCCCRSAVTTNRRPTTSD